MHHFRIFFTEIATLLPVLMCLVIGKIADAKTPRPIIICGVYEDVSGVSVQALFYRDGYYQGINRDWVSQTELFTDSSFFYLTLQPNKELSYLSLAFSSGESTRFLLNRYLVEAGDSVYIRVRGDTLVFTGIGAAKYEYQYLASLDRNPYTEEEIQALQRLNIPQDPYHPAFLSFSYKRNIALLAKKKRLLEDYECKISGAAYDRLAFDGYAGAALSALDGISLLLGNVKSGNRTKAVIRHFKDHFDDWDIGNYDRPHFVESKFYSDFLLRKALISIGLGDNEGDYDRDIPFGKLYHHLEEEYQGEIRDKLLASCFARRFRAGTDDISYLNSAIEAVKHPLYKAMLLKLIDTQTRGVSAYPFCLSDAKGNMVSLSDFKGKVVVMDFWFTGCSACIALEREMKEVRQYFATNSDVVFVSVSADKDKSLWLQRVNSGAYSDPEGINLYTNGEGFSHQMMIHYAFDSLPRILIIGRDQNVFACNPQRPNNTSGNMDFIRLIMTALHN